MAKKETTLEISIQRIKQGQLNARILGTMPLYLNAMSAKAQRSLLLGGGKKTAAEKLQMKHDPEQEFRDSCYKIHTGPTLLCMPAAAIKSAMATAALVTPGMKKTDVQRLVFMPQQMIPIWGKPYLKMDVVRSADMARTPDIRTRAFLPQWCAEVVIQFATPNLSAVSVVSLLANAGVVAGIGDFRQEKGRGSFGTFEPITEEANADFDALMSQGRDVQQHALDNPEMADEATQELMGMVHIERVRRAA